MSDISRLDALLPQSVGSTEKKAVSSKVSGVQPGENFSDLLKNALNSVNDAQSEAAGALEQVLSGDSKDIHETMVALQKADVSLKMMLEVRNKILEAYQEVMRTQM